MINVGIIGCGKIAQVRHIPEYASNPNVKICGFYDINKERARKLAEKYNAYAYDSFEDLLKNDDIEAVSVCTSNSSHSEVTIAALNAGKHVLCEKPMGTSINECEEMVIASKKANRYLMIGHNQRLAKSHVWAKKLIDDGAIGSIISFRTTFGHGGPETWSIDPGAGTWFFDKKRAYFGAIGDLGIHKTDLIQFLTGHKVKEVMAKLTTLDKCYADGKLIGVDDNAFCIYTMDNGITGTMTASWTFYGEEDNSTILYGTKGIMRIYDNPEYSIKIVTRGGEKITYNIDSIQTNYKQTSSGVIDAFVDCIINGKKPEISGEDGLNTMKAVFACLESSNTGRKVIVI